MSDNEAKSERKILLDRAESCVMRERNAMYGPPTQDFDRIASMMNVLYPDGHGRFTGHDVAVLMIVLKLSRLTHGPGQFDTWVDIAGYAACGWECSVAEARDAV